MPNERDWLRAEERGEDPLAEMLFARLIAGIPPVEPGPEFVSRAVSAAWRARARNRLVMRLAGIAAVLTVAIASFGSIYELRGLLVDLIAHMAAVSSHGLVWLLTYASHEARWWWIAERIGTAVSDAIAAPYAAAAFVGVALIALVALYAFKRVIHEGWQTENWETQD